MGPLDCRRQGIGVDKDFRPRSRDDRPCVRPWNITTEKLNPSALGAHGKTRALAVRAERVERIAYA
jgi:hypothetical protein